MPVGINLYRVGFLNEYVLSSNRRRRRTACCFITFSCPWSVNFVRVNVFVAAIGILIPRTPCLQHMASTTRIRSVHQLRFTRAHHHNLRADACFPVKNHITRPRFAPGSGGHVPTRLNVEGKFSFNFSGPSVIISRSCIPKLDVPG